MLLKDLLPDVTSKLKPGYCEFAQPYAEKILEYLLGCTRSQLYADGKRVVDDALVVRCQRIVEQCTAGVPLDYIIGVSYFYNREFKVTPDVLIPRPDTEIVVETVLGNETEDPAFFADIGTGSGIIACILTEQRSAWCAAAVDCSIAALRVAQRNRHSERVFPLCGDVLSMVLPQGQFDFIVSNPPYIPSATIATLDESVRTFEPVTALDGGSDGLHFYRYLAQHATAVLKNGGALYCEIGCDQRNAIEALFGVSHWTGLEFFNDLAGHTRVFKVNKND